MQSDRTRKVEDPGKRCPRCDGTGEMDEVKHNRSFGPSTYQFGTCDDCGGTGRKPVDNSENTNK